MSSSHHIENTRMERLELICRFFAARRHPRPHIYSSQLAVQRGSWCYHSPFLEIIEPSFSTDSRPLKSRKQGSDQSGIDGCYGIIFVCLNIDLSIDLTKIALGMASAWIAKKLTARRENHKLKINGEQTIIKQPHIEKALQSLVDDAESQEEQ